MIYTKDFAFIHIPKTSGMSIKASIALNCSDAKYMPENTFSEETQGVGWREVMHYPYSYWEHLIKDKWVFSVVRNPFVRAVSLYVYLKEKHINRHKWVDLKFEDLYTPQKMDTLYLPTLTQTEFLTGSQGIVPNIFKYEDGYSSLEDRLGFKISVKDNANDKYNYLDYYDEKREKLILNLFEKDFENFGYSTHLD